MKSSPTPQGSPGRRDVFMALAAAIVATGVLQALRLSWTADDAHLSFRYAEQLVRGHGLVFNPGERVEGYTNFLWTLWSAVGLRCGVGPERWADSWSIACYAGTLALMAGLSWRDRDPRTLAVPIAACLYALHHDAASFATSGLETAAFCFLALAGYVLLTSASIGLARSVAAGAVLALCTLTRPDGAVFALLGFAYLCFDIRRHPRAPRAYLVTLVILLAPYLAWKWRFYGDLLPNTFYAKSGYASWYSQGGTYLLLYLRRYWVLVLGPLVALPIPVPRAAGSGAEFAGRLRGSRNGAGAGVRVRVRVLDRARRGRLHVRAHATARHPLPADRPRARCRATHSRPRPRPGRRGGRIGGRRARDPEPAPRAPAPARHRR